MLDEVSEDPLIRALLEQPAAIARNEGRAEKCFVRGKMIGQIVDQFRKRLFDRINTRLILNQSQLRDPFLQ